MRKLILVSLLFCSSSFAQESSRHWEALKESFTLLAKGSYMQFTQINNLGYAALATPSLIIAAKEDDRLANHYRGQNISNAVDLVGDLSVVLNQPFFPAAIYFLGDYKNNSHSVQFAKELFAATYLALGESGLLSFIDIHKRPSSDKLSFWEKSFRGDSSFPSGHVIPYQVLFFKTLQFYGPAWSIIPLGLSVVASMQRVQDRKHYVSDVVGSFFLSAFASEGVRAAANYSSNDSFYKKYFERSDLQVGILRYQNAIGPMVSLKY
tara:strand:- start:26083 stop:26877 length:795 start_codon:yes stop_codon:yes gene_type:complete